MEMKIPNCDKTLTRSAFVVGEGMAGCQYAYIALQIACYLKEKNRNRPPHHGPCCRVGMGTQALYKSKTNDTRHSIRKGCALGQGVSLQLLEAGSAIAILVSLGPFPRR